MSTLVLQYTMKPLLCSSLICNRILWWQRNNCSMLACRLDCVIKYTGNTVASKGAGFYGYVSDDPMTMTYSSMKSILFGPFMFVCVCVHVFVLDVCMWVCLCVWVCTCVPCVCMCVLEWRKDTVLIRLLCSVWMLKDCLFTVCSVTDAQYIVIL